MAEVYLWPHCLPHQRGDHADRNRDDHALGDTLLSLTQPPERLGDVGVLLSQVAVHCIELALDGADGTQDVSMRDLVIAWHGQFCSVIVLAATEKVPPVVLTSPPKSL